MSNVKLSESKESEHIKIGADTSKLLNPSSFEPASVTENSTELLHVEQKPRKFE